MSDSITKEHGTADRDKVFERVRVEVRKFLKNGIAPEEISFALSYIATELGLAVATNPLDVFPVVFSAVSQASAASSAGKEDGKPAVVSDSPPPQNTTIH